MIYLGADHRGYQLKEKIKEWLGEWARLAEGDEPRRRYEYEDLGNKKYDPEDDYPTFAIKVAKEIRNSKFEIRNLGILICGSGIGMDMVANKLPGIRCGLGFSVGQIKRGREEDDINCLALAADFVSNEEAKEIVKAFLKTKFLGKGKYRRRIEKITKINPTG